MSEKSKNMPWRNAEFEKKFREAMGREMTQQEREFFGLNGMDEQSRSEESDSGPNIPSDKGQFAWEALRRVSALID
jgi:hypothetical protein